MTPASGLPGVLDRLFDLALGGRETDRSDPRARRGKAPFAEIESDQLFIDVVRLPAATIVEARNAIALQADRLIPFNPGDADWDVVALDDDDTTGQRRAFLLAAAPTSVLADARLSARDPSAIEGFCAIVESNGQTRSVVFRDAATVSARRARRLRLLGAAALALGAFAFLGDAIGAWTQSQGGQRTAALDKLEAAITQARDREANAKALIASVQQASHGDALNATVGALATLSAPAVPGLSIEKIETDARTIRLSGITENPETTERALRSRRGITISSFTASPTADPFGRGYRVNVVLIWGGDLEPS